MLLPSRLYSKILYKCGGINMEEEEKAVKEIMKAVGLLMTDLASDKRTKISVYDVFLALVLLKDRCSAAESLDITKSKLEYILNTRIAPLLPPKVKQEQWHVYLLSLASLRRCAMCNRIKNVSEFTKDINRTSGINGYCRLCSCEKRRDYSKENPEHYSNYRKNNPQQHRAYTAAYQAAKINAIPKWANTAKIEEIYRNCPQGMQVDHIVPLRGTQVCGFHVENNLQYLSPKENMQKSNKLLMEHT
jgi:hypothetical protein